MILPIIILVTAFSSLIQTLPEKIILVLPYGQIEFVNSETDPTLAKLLEDNNGYIKGLLEEQKDEEVVIIPLNSGEALPIFEALDRDIGDQLKKYITDTPITKLGRKNIKKLEQLGKIANFLDNKTLLDAVVVEISQQKKYQSLCKIFGDDTIVHGNPILTNLLSAILTKTPIPYRTLAGHTNSIYSLAKLNDHMFASGSSDNTIRIWDLNTGQSTKTLTGHTGSVDSLVKLNESTLASGSSDNTIRIWDPNTGQSTKTLTEHTGAVDSLAKLNEETLASGSSDKNIRIWDLTTGLTTKILTGHTEKVSSITKLNEHTLASGSRDNNVRIWDLNTGLTTHILTEHTDEVLSLAKLNEHTLASGSSDKTIRIWDLNTGQTTKILTGHTGDVLSLAKLNEHTLASGSSDKTIRIWDLTAFNKVTTFLENPTCMQLITLYNVLNKLPLTREQHDIYTTLHPAIQKAFPLKQSYIKSGLTKIYNKFRKTN